MSEKFVVKKYKNGLNRRVVFAHKVHGRPMSAGFPDIIGCIRGIRG